MAKLNVAKNFDNFAVGECNKLAYAAANQAIIMCGMVYNPLFIYGGPGSGKTHLLNAIGLSFKDGWPGTRLLYVRAEEFRDEVIGYIRSGLQEAHDSFRRKYESLDVLIVDDINEIAGMDVTQENFLSIFNFLHEEGRQIILSADTKPSEIRNLDERLVRRFSWGFMAELGELDISTKTTILRNLTEAQGMKLDSDILYYMAGKIKESYELGQIVNELRMYSLINVLAFDEITMSHVKDMLEGRNNME